MRISAICDATALVPHQVASASSIARVGRRAAVWLRNRASGIGPALHPSSLIVRPLTPEERQARAVRLARKPTRKESR